MSLDDLSASELARIDAVCLRYEADLRQGLSPSIEALVAQHGGASSEVLRDELESVRDELALASKSELPSGASPEVKVKLPTIGMSIGPYRIDELLGRGGMGVVFKAQDQRLGRSVAIKMLAIEIMDRRDVNERFQREARAIAGLSHPNIVELFDVGSNDGLPYAVMEHLDGESLDARLARKPLSIDEVRRIGAQIADALSTAHSAGIVHRDLKPHNIMLVRRTVSTDESSAAESNAASVKLFDFGLSRVPRLSIDDDAEQTREGMILGTPGYMAPEQASGEAITPAADIFSLGCVLYEAFYRNLAFDGTTKAARLVSTINQVPKADEIRRRDDPALANLIDQCLLKDALRRPSAGEAAARLAQGTYGDHGIDGRSSVDLAARDQWGRHRWSRRRWVALLAASSAGVIAGVLIARSLIGRNDKRLSDVRSLAVISFTDASSEATTPDSDFVAEPLGDKTVHRGEEFAALLVHELSRMSKVRVPSFRPITAISPAQYRDWGRQLGVDAILSGSIQSVPNGDDSSIEVNLKIVSADSGNQLWTRTIRSQAGDDLLEQSRLATEIAAVVGESLTSTASGK